MCCQVVGVSRSTIYYQRQLDDSDVKEKLRKLADKIPNRGFDQYYKRIRREGHKWARSRVLRVYRDLGMVRRPKRRRKLAEQARKPLKQPAKLNQV